MKIVRFTGLVSIDDGQQIALTITPNGVGVHGGGLTDLQTEEVMRALVELIQPFTKLAAAEGGK